MNNVSVAFVVLNEHGEIWDVESDAGAAEARVAELTAQWEHDGHVFHVVEYVPRATAQTEVEGEESAR